MIEKLHSFAYGAVVSKSARQLFYLRPILQIAGKGCRSARLLCCLFILFFVANRDVYGAVDAASVQRAIDRGITYLRGTQNGSGGWKEYGSQPCGGSALCTLGLLNCGVAKDDPAIVNAMRYLRKFQPNATYSVALQTLVFCQLGEARDLPAIQRNVDWLVREQVKGGLRSGAWGYSANSGAGDPSNTQFAILALDAARDRGIQIDPTTFQRAIEYWTVRQAPGGGGWGYRGGDSASGSMTCAAIASLIIARRGSASGTSRINGDNIQCCGQVDSPNDPVESGLRWLGRNFTLEANPGGSEMTHFYYLYALERVGRLAGRRFIGQHDWYREVAEKLLKIQDQFQGFWIGKGTLGENDRNVVTAFALLILGKGKRQVVAGQLQYSPAADQWQQHPDGLRQLVRHLERDWGRDLTWQTVRAENAGLTDLMQTPVLIISGHEPLRLSDRLSDNLKQYVDQGGVLLFEAEGGDGCGDGSAFEASVAELCTRWYPGTQLTRLPPSHPIWTAERNVDPQEIGDDFWVYGLQACCRTAIFYVPQSLSCRWQLGDVLLKPAEVSDGARRSIDAAIRIGENLIAYATGKELKDKLDQRVVIKGAQLDQPKRGVIRLVTLAFDAGGDQAARAVPNAAGLIRGRVPIEIAAAIDPVGFDAQQLVDVPILWVHGRTDFSWTAKQREVLREYVQNGGLIFGTSICGEKSFTEAFRREIQLVLPNASLRPMPVDHAALTTNFGGFDIRQISIRKPGSQGDSSVSSRVGPPSLEVATVNGLDAVFFSPLDISCALESQNSVQCPGYPTNDAAKIVANLVLYGFQQ